MLKLDEENPCNKIEDTSITYNSLEDIPVDLLTIIKESMIEATKTKPELDENGLDLSSLTPNEDNYTDVISRDKFSFEHNELVYEMHMIEYDEQLVLEKGSEYPITDIDTFEEGIVEILRNIEVPLHHLIYCNYAYDSENQKLVFDKAIVHKYTYVEYAKSVLAQL